MSAAGDRQVVVADDLRARVAEIKAFRGFEASKWWLAFYLGGAVERLERSVPQLAVLGAINLDDNDCGFLYPKIETASKPVRITEVVAAVQAICSDCGVQLLHVDVDTSPSVVNSRFELLIDFEKPVGERFA
ncbi:hypothetical protein [Stakelama tenebrarum]|uniref:Uncharacterized protein n=1 Tax=Stakelama tenebrarum TaxID=2711215 RepID=A0A6G6Y714_9SPHN|nr:hypothetical protein [Sphingosinithalassobacter tenebrarum]QIG80587.1 hypothetical protein G5C33_12885 [Sphingosinithalassobacter tenebrarum]